MGNAKGHGRVAARDPLKTAGALEALLDQAKVAGALKDKTNAELGLLLLDHVWAEMDLTSPQAALLSEAIHRLNPDLAAEGNAEARKEEPLECACHRDDAGGSFMLVSVAGGASSGGFASAVSCLRVHPDGRYKILRYVLAPDCTGCGCAGDASTEQLSALLAAPQAIQKGRSMSMNAGPIEGTVSMWTDGTDWVIARSLEEARREVALCLGERLEDISDSSEWDREPEGTIHTIRSEGGADTENISTCAILAQHMASDHPQVPMCWGSTEW